MIYENTDQKDSTRLGDTWEWTTSVVIRREGSFVRSGLETVDETEIFKGNESSLLMRQAYTRDFQCAFELTRYPFDTQVYRFAYQKHTSSKFTFVSDLYY